MRQEQIRRRPRRRPDRTEPAPLRRRCSGGGEPEALDELLARIEGLLVEQARGEPEHRAA